MNKNLVKSLKVDQWRNTDSVINWFNDIENKSQCFFILLDIVEFYTKYIGKYSRHCNQLCKTIYTDIFDKNLRIIKHCCKSLFYNKHEPWKKKDTNSCFNVTMGSYNGVENCELVGIYLLSLLANINKNNSGLYCDDGLIYFCNVNGQKMDRARKNVIKIFKEVGFKTEIQTQLKIVIF